MQYCVSNNCSSHYLDAPITLLDCFRPLAPEGEDADVELRSKYKTNSTLLCITYLHSFLPSDVEKVRTASQRQLFVVALAAVSWHQPVCLAQPGMSVSTSSDISVKFSECA